MLRHEYVLKQFDYKMYELCYTMGRMSSCSHKQVGAVIVRDGKILGVGYNHVLSCNGLHDKTCTVSHAEVEACPGIAINGSICYVNLFPCEACQRYLWSRGVREIRVFGKQGTKPMVPLADLLITVLPDLPALLLNYNKEHKARQVVQGELAELTTAISNLDARDDRPESRGQLIDDIAGETVDVALQLNILRLSLRDENFHFLESQARHTNKWNKLLTKFESNFFPDKDLS